jgi:hypothetical protein
MVGAMRYGIRTGILLVTLVVTTLWAKPAKAEDFGLGVILGSPTGLSLEYSLGSDNSIHAALGLEGFNNRGRDDDFYVHVVWKYYLAELASTGDFTLPFYIGIGPYIGDLGNDIDLGARAPFGIAFSFTKAPIDIFLELPILFEVIDDPRFGVGAALGFHYFF